MPRGKIGSSCLFSTATKIERSTKLRQKRETIAGWDQGNLTPPSSIGSRKARMPKVKRKEPLKSTRLILLFPEILSSTPSEEEDVAWEPGRETVTRKIASRMGGTWPKKDLETRR